MYAYVCFFRREFRVAWFVVMSRMRLCYYGNARNYLFLTCRLVEIIERTTVLIFLAHLPINTARVWGCSEESQRLASGSQDDWVGAARWGGRWRAGCVRTGEWRYGMLLNVMSWPFCFIVRVKFNVRTFCYDPDNICLLWGSHIYLIILYFLYSECAFRDTHRLSFVMIWIFAYRDLHTMQKINGEIEKLQSELEKSQQATQEGTYLIQ